MIIYNVTVNVDEGIHDSWLTYMKDEHIPDVMKTGCFEEFTFSRIITKQIGESGVTYAVQYKCRDMETYQSYQEKHAPALQEDHTKKFGGKFHAFRTLLEEVE